MALITQTEGMGMTAILVITTCFLYL